MATSQKPRKKKTDVVMMPVPTPQVNISKQPMWFPIDWDKVKTLEDIKIILKNMGLGCQDNAPNYPELKKYLSNIPTKQ
jgi:hypothetical protein